jgi:putative heme-binding domain-containing protein
LCVACHGPTGTNVGGIDLRRGPLRRAPTDEALAGIITTGFPGSGMPGVRLEPGEVRALVAFVRAGFDTTAPATVASGDPARGRAVFEGEGECLRCHSMNGRGKTTGLDLAEIGRIRSAASIRLSLVDPTSAMRPINRPVRAVGRDGAIITGRRLNEDSYTVQLMTDEGRLVSFVKSELKSLTVGTTSTMPSYRETLSPAAIADLVAYLATLKGSQP